jgi:hypothetical protein
MNIYGTTDDEGQGVVIKSAGELDMGGNKIINVKTPIQVDDAATAGYVSSFVSSLNNIKVNWSGGTMTGDLSMGTHKLTNLAVPEDMGDAVNLQYLTQIGYKRLVNIDSLGRYIIFSDESGKKIYVSVRAKRNIDLVNELLVEMKNNIVDPDENDFYDPTTTKIRHDITLLPNRDKPLGIIQLNSTLQIIFKNNNQQTPPWIFLFSAKPGASPPTVDNISNITVVNPANQRTNYIKTKWTAASFKYAITRGDMTPENTTTLDVDTTVFNHIAFEYVGTRLTVWLNGESRKTHNIDLGNLSSVVMGVKELGILSIYNKDLSKAEIIQHYIDHHVGNFTNDEVLI